MNKENFCFLGTALKSDLNNLDYFESAKALLIYLEQEMDDNEEIIQRYMFQNIDNITLEDGTVYHLKNIANLYDYLTIVKHPEDDCAYHITKNLQDNELLNLPKKFFDAYMYVCRNVDVLLNHPNICDTDINAQTHLKILKKVL